MMIILNLRNTSSHGVNRISRNALIAVPLKYFSNFWSSLEMRWNNCKLELTLYCTKYCVLSAAGADNVNGNVNNNANGNNIIFTVKDIKLYVPVSTARENQKLSNVLNKGFERSFIGMNVKQNETIKIQQINLDIFSNQTLLQLIDYLF